MLKENSKANRPLTKKSGAKALKPLKLTFQNTKDICEKFGFNLNELEQKKITDYLALLQKWNRTMNLVGKNSWYDILTELVFDSFYLEKHLQNHLKLTQFENIWDLGSGAGLPGIPLRIVWESGTYYLIEAREKRSLFLQTAVSSLTLLNTKVFHGRAEDFMQEEKAKNNFADLIISRAFMPYDKMLPFVVPYLQRKNAIKSNGSIIFLTLDPLKLSVLNAENWQVKEVIPCFVTDLAKIRYNVNILNEVQKRTGAKILLALKGFAQFSTFKIISRAMNGPLYGACASSVDEARLAKEEFKGEVHAFAAAFSDCEMQELLPLIDHITFNSISQWKKFKPIIQKYILENKRDIICGLRVNPEHSEGAVPIYDPCDPSSRLGIRLKDLAKEDYSELFKGITGIHFHTLCEQNSDALARTLEVVEAKFGHILEKMQWVNFGGGHHITRDDYDLDLLCSCISNIQEKYQVQVYLEPGEAIAYKAGYLVTTVLDIVEADRPTIIFDSSAACHMPDVIEMPYRPEIIGAGEDNEKAYSYRIGGKSCLAGDVVNIYSFDKEIQEGDKLIFEDMAIYSMVKTNTFNGIRLPSIALWDSETNEIISIKHFDYLDFKNRLS